MYIILPAYTKCRHFFSGIGRKTRYKGFQGLKKVVLHRKLCKQSECMKKKMIAKSVPILTEPRNLFVLRGKVWQCCVSINE